MNEKTPKNLAASIRQRLTYVARETGRPFDESIAKTFANRGTTIAADPTAFSDEFATDPSKNTQWRAFVRKSRLAHAPEEFSATVESVVAFLQPLAIHASQGQSFSKIWRTSGPRI